MDREADMRAMLESLKAGPQTRKVQRAIRNIENALARPRPPRREPPRRQQPNAHRQDVVTYDREKLMLLADSPRHNENIRLWARNILDGNGTMTEADARFLRAL
ncbi:MAG: hypothetical protein V2I33_23660 [Kangiellaceae bacterium]|jgi:hypothetical protein|nr:hypothetical protein [Kangiellaceae bacterium]